MEIRKSELYKQIKSDKSDKVIAIPYYKDTGLLITEDNYEFVIDIEMINLNKKINSIKESLPDYKPEDNIEDKIRQSVVDRIGENKLEIGFIYVNSETIDDAIDQVVKSEDFFDWC